MEQTQLPRLVSFTPSVFLELTGLMQSCAANISHVFAIWCPFVLKYGVVWHGNMVQMQMHVPVIMRISQPGINHQHTVLDQSQLCDQ